MKGASLEEYLKNICENPYGLIMLLMKQRGDQAHATRFLNLIVGCVLQSKTEFW
jgi:hypothetical protein